MMNEWQPQRREKATNLLNVYALWLSVFVAKTYREKEIKKAHL